ncbi:MAG: hypothetical protein ACREKL_13080 [Chthoniobacterales bacterium]
MKFARSIFAGLLLACGAVTFTGCQTWSEDNAQREAMNQAILQEQPGNYFIARRFYKQDYKIWGWVRSPGQPWSTAQLVMLNEQKMLAPDRARNDIGFDNNYEYRLSGYFSGDKIYEPASDTVYPEFVLTGAEVRSIDPPLIFKDRRSIDPKVRLLVPPI